MKNALNWFEIPVSDFDRAATFYNQIFDVKMHSEDMKGFKMAFLPMEGQGVGGALVHGEGYVPSMNGAVIYLNAQPDLNVILSRVESAGGKVLMPKMLIAEDLGYMAFISDSEGNKVGLHSMS